MLERKNFKSEQFQNSLSYKHVLKQEVLITWILFHTNCGLQNYVLKFIFLNSVKCYEAEA